MIQTAIFDFLKGLSKNNNKEWFQAHKSEYDSHKQGFAHMTELAIRAISEFDKSISGLEPKDCVFRINRDVRFSNDKSPYKANFGSFIAPGGRNTGMAGYYMHIEPGGCFLSGGIYMPSSQNLKKIRKEIFDNYEEFLEIINNKDFKKHFGVLWGEKLKTRPVGFPEDFEGLEYLKFKHYTVIKEIPDKEMISQGILKEISQVFSSLYPFVRFINQAILEG
jgi:uncharacterized protein (TIGR02453 family)